jgi:hypothetical protein
MPYLRHRSNIHFIGYILERVMFVASTCSLSFQLTTATCSLSFQLTTATYYLSFQLTTITCPLSFQLTTTTCYLSFQLTTATCFLSFQLTTATCSFFPAHYCYVFSILLSRLCELLWRMFLVCCVVLVVKFSRIFIIFLPSYSPSLVMYLVLLK